MPRTSVYFIADVHLVPLPDEGQLAREHDLIEFLRSIRDDAEVLYIVGDLFDFWFEYQSVIPRAGARVLFELYNLVQAGARLVCLPGNHDIWIGSYLRDQIGAELPGGPIAIEHQGLRIFLAHGDEFRTDRKFRFSRSILKSPFWIACFRWIHPDVGAWLARWTSSLSEYRARGSAGRNIRYLRDLAERKLPEGFDAFICGHYHLPVQESVEPGSLMVLGDWISHSSYGRLRDGRLELIHWTSRPDSEQ